MINIDRVLESGHHFKNNELPLKFKFRFINIIMIVIVITSTVFGFLHYFKLAPTGNFHANVNFFFAGFNLFLIFWLRQSKELYDTVLTLILTSSLMTFTSALIMIPNDEFRIIWFYIAVFLAFFAGGLGYGYVTAAVSIFIILFSNIFFDLQLSSLSITTALTGLLITTIAVKAYTQKMLDLEHAFITLNNSLHTKVKSSVEEVRKKDEYILQQSRLAQMGEMIAMIAHQWRQPLSSISTISAKLQLSIVLKEELTPEALTHELRTIDKRIALLSNTIDDFRNFYNTSNEKRAFDLSTTIKQAIEVLSPAIDNAHVHLHFDDRLSHAITGLEGEMIQVLMNIINNAIDVLKEHKREGFIWITATQDSSKTYIHIEDSGGGVSDDILDQIFDPYFSTKKEKHGMGLGLYMSKLIIHEHCGGVLFLENTDQGARFSIKIPSH